MQGTAPSSVDSSPGRICLSRATRITRRGWSAAICAGASSKRTDKSTSPGTSVTPIDYEVRVAGILPPEALLDLESVTAAVQPAETFVHAPLQDQATLSGLLARLEASGIEIVNLHRIHDRDSAAS